MGLKVITEKGPVTVYANEKTTQNGGKFTTYCISVASKDQNGNWVNGFIDCQFKKADVEKITNKCKINISNSFYTVNEYNGKKYLKLFVLDFEVAEDGEKPQAAPTPSSDEFLNIPDGLEGELPF